MSALIKSSLARKVVMALSGIFLVFFLGQHFTINLTSVIAPDAFNTLSHFLGYNPLIQFVLQPVLIAGVIVHFVMGFVLEIQNRAARGPVKYANYKGGANASWVSRNMIISGAAILAFICLHFYDFWWPEITYKYIEGNPENATKYLLETNHKFEPFWRTILYVISFVLLSLHLLHGFSSSLQTMGLNNKYSAALKIFTKAYAILIPLGFVFVALYHHFNQIPH